MLDGNRRVNDLVTILTTFTIYRLLRPIHLEPVIAIEDNLLHFEQQ